MTRSLTMNTTDPAKTDQRLSASSVADGSVILWRCVNGALKCTIDAHGPITKENYGSAGKRIAAQLAAEEHKSNGAQMPTERKVMVAIAGLCIAILCAALLGIAFYVHVIAGLLMLAMIAWWLGSAIAETLKKTKDESSPTGGVERRRKER